LRSRAASIVVLTPVRNEAWILDTFLRVTSTFADHILVADQGSTDESRAICGRHSKVKLIDNPSSSYDEADRQRLLIHAARSSVPGPRILLALDADEFVAADAPASEDWGRMRELPPGTVLAFEKPDLYGSFARCLRYANPWPLGYSDDGIEHQGRSIHSLRIPTPPGSPVAHLSAVKVIHYAMLDLRRQAAKARFYAVQENLRNSSPLVRRRLTYAANRDWSASGTLAAPLDSWFAGWEAAGIPVRASAEEQFYWQDYEVLRILQSHGGRRFWLDDIWQFDWEGCRTSALRRGEPGVSASPIQRPPRWSRIAARLLDAAYAGARRLRNR
jgi:hypothetical protein